MGVRDCADTREDKAEMKAGYYDGIRGKRLKKFNMDKQDEQERWITKSVNNEKTRKK